MTFAINNSSNETTYFSAKKRNLRSSRSSDSDMTPCDKDAKKENKMSSISMVAQQMEAKLNLGNHLVPSNVADFDKENWEDIFQVSNYAMDIFNYLKEREVS